MYIRLIEFSVNSSVGPYENSEEFSNSTNGGNFTDNLRDYRLPSMAPDLLSVELTSIKLILSQRR
jgi:hypothetical protein